MSQSAVSRAFTVGASVAPETREKIVAVAERLGYRPNLLARSLINGRSNIVGVGVGSLHNPFFVEMLELLSRALDAAGVRLLLFPAEQGDGPEPSLHEILHYRLHALVLLSVNFSSSLADECRRARVPVVLVNRTVREDSVSSVTCDNALGARTIAAHLLAGGHRKIAFIAGSANSSTNQERESAFADYLAKNGNTVRWREEGHFAFDPAMAATRRLLTGEDKPDAIFCANDTMAIAAINVAHVEFGMDVGKEISIVGYDDVPLAAWPAFSLTTYSQPAQLMVDETLDLIRHLRDDPDRHSHRTLTGSLVVRGSSRRT